jgi:glycosyltransferase involved in cell wall biosynthesis
MKEIKKSQFRLSRGECSRHAPPIPRSTRLPKIVCIIPTLNEGVTVSEVIRKATPFVDHVVVVDGHSQDETCALARKAGSAVIYQEGKGKGMALRTAINQVDADIYVTIDGDATYDAEEMDQLIQPILDGDADMVIGSRLRGKMEHGSISTLNILGNHLFNLLINSLFGGRITDSQSGFRAFRRQGLEGLTLSSQGFEIETELTVKALQRGLTILEIPITYGARRGTPSKLSALSAGSRIVTTILSCSLAQMRGTCDYAPSSLALR